MKKILFIFCLFIAASSIASAQSVVNTAEAIKQATSAPSGACYRGRVRVYASTVYVCPQSGTATWTAIGGSSGIATGDSPTATGAWTFSKNGALGTPTISLTGTWITGGTATTTKPLVLIEPTGTTSTGWSTNGTGLGINAASGFTGNLIDGQVAGTNKFKVDANGLITSYNDATNNFTLGAASSKTSLTGVRGVEITSGAGWTVSLVGPGGVVINSGGSTFLRAPSSNVFTLGTTDGASPSAQTFNVQSATGTNVAGASPTKIIASLGTGNAAPGAIAIQGGARSATSGTTVQTAISREIIGNAITVSNNTTTTVTGGSWTLASNTVLGGKVTYTVEVFDGTELQVETGEVALMGINKGGVFSNNTALKYGNQQAATSGTLTVTWSMTGANPSLLQVNVNSSLTPTTGYPRVTYTIVNNGQQAVQ